jgi:hypothetical protein
MIGTGRGDDCTIPYLHDLEEVPSLLTMTVISFFKNNVEFTIPHRMMLAFGPIEDQSLYGKNARRLSVSVNQYAIHDR